MLCLGGVSDPYAGGSPDWAKGVANITYSYAFELRDKGHYGFLLPVNQSLAVGQETYGGLRVMGQELTGQYKHLLHPVGRASGLAVNYGALSCYT